MSDTAPAAPQFADLGLPAPLLEALNSLGYETPSPIQAEAIPTLLAAVTVVFFAIRILPGDPAIAIAGALYFDALARNDSVNYEKATTMINALAVNGMVTLALKGIVRTRSPNGDPFGWPSGHTSSSFAFATVAYEQYGPWVGIPLYAFASYVGYERIDARNHDFSDVISGAILGTVIGHVISQNHMPRIAGFEVMPYVCPSNDSFGVMLCKRW